MPAAAACLCFTLRAQENRYVGFGNTVPPQKKEDDFLNNAMSSLYSVRVPTLQSTCHRQVALAWQYGRAWDNLSFVSSD